MMADKGRINAQHVQGGIVDIGGQQTFHGAVSVTIRDMTQTIASSPNADEAAKAELEKRMKQLGAVLQQVPADKQDEAQMVARRAEELVTEATQPQPDKESVEFKGNKLKQAAEHLRDVAPIVAQTAMGIVRTIGQFVQ